MSIRSKIGKVKRWIVRSVDVDNGYMRKYKTYCFNDSNCQNYEQFEAAITRLYHTIEKGLSYENYRAGFGKSNIDKLLNAMESYVQKGYDTEAFFYRTALSCLYSYIERNAENGCIEEALNSRVKTLPGIQNDEGGAFWYTPTDEANVQKLPFDDFLRDRHSIRHFDDRPVSIETVKKAIELAQHTPSACNRQGWSTRIVCDKTVLKIILENQNGNRGFGQEFDKILVVTGDVRYFSKSRETFQVFIDGGMYAENVLNALHFYHSQL